MRLTLLSSFSAAHCLPDHPGQCKNMHGHTWKVKTTISGPVDKDTGMLIDFKDFERKVNPVIDMLDHSFINNFPYFQEKPPTAENIAIFIYEAVQTAFSSHHKITVESVEVWESDKASAVYEGGDGA